MIHAVYAVMDLTLARKLHHEVILPPWIHCHCKKDRVTDVLMAHVLLSSGEEGDVGSDRPPRDPHPPQHNRPQHPDQRRLRADHPVDPRAQTAPRGRQTAEVRLFSSLSEMCAI